MEETRRMGKNLAAAFGFSCIYMVCMYHNSASITFPILMAAAIVLLYCLCEQRRFFDNKISTFYAVSIMIIAVSVAFTADSKLHFMSKCMVLGLYVCLAIELFCNTGQWTDAVYVKKLLFIPLVGVVKGFSLLEDYHIYREEKRETSEEHPSIWRRTEVKQIVKGILIAAVLLVVILPLMMTADAAFYNMMKNVFDMEDFFTWLFCDINIIEMFVIFGFILLFSYGLGKILLEQKDQFYTKVTNKAGLITGITAIGIVGVVYVVFSIVTIWGILDANVSLPERYTYAEYAREGFFELLWLAIINMLIVLVGKLKYEDHPILKLILLVMNACTYVMLFVSAYKMFLYIEVYHMTFLRFMVLWALALMFVLMMAVVRYVWRDDFSLFRVASVIITVFYLGIAIARPDYAVASYNVKHMPVTQWEYGYFTLYSADAYPVLRESDFELSPHYERKIEQQAKEMNWRTFNFSIYMAKKALESE